MFPFAACANCAERTIESLGLVGLAFETNQLDDWQTSPFPPLKDAFLFYSGEFTILVLPGIRTSRG